MTNKEAAQILREYPSMFKGYSLLEISTALEIAIRALEGTDNADYIDCISRQEALDAVSTAFLGLSFERYKAAKKLIEKLPAYNSKHTGEEHNVYSDD